MSDKEKQFEAYDFDRDERWQSFRNSVDGLDEGILRRRFYRRHIDPALPVEAPSFGYSAPTPEPAAEPPQPQQAPPPNADGAPVRTLQQKLLSKEGIWFLSHTFVVLNAVIFLLRALLNPSGAGTNYRWAFIGAAFSYALVFTTAAGGIKFSKEMLRKVIEDDNGQYFLYSLLCLNATPVIWALVPITTCAAFHASSYGDGLLQVHRPDLYGKFHGWLMKVINHIQLLLQVNSFVELLLCFHFFLNIFAGIRNIFMFYLYFNWLRFRYETSAYTQTTLHDLVGKLDSWAYHQRCPGVIRNFYTKVRTYIGSFRIRQHAQ